MKRIFGVTTRLVALLLVLAGAATAKTGSMWVPSSAPGAGCGTAYSLGAGEALDMTVHFESGPCIAQLSGYKSNRFNWLAQTQVSSCG